MTEKVARQIADAFTKYQYTVDNDFYLYTEAMAYLIKKEHRISDMIDLAVEYMNRDKYMPAKRFFEMAAEVGDKLAIFMLGEFYYKGYGVDVDFGKAYTYYSRVAGGKDKALRIFSRTRLANMYRYGQYVPQDKNKSLSMAEEVYRDSLPVGRYSYPEWDLCEMIADLYLEKGNEEKTVFYYEEAIRYAAMNDIIKPDADEFTDVSSMQQLVKKLYTIPSYRPEKHNLMSLYYLLGRAGTVIIHLGGKEYHAQAVEKGDCITIRFEGKDYRSVDELLNRGRIDGRRLEKLHDDVEEVTVLEPAI